MGLFSRKPKLMAEERAAGLQYFRAVTQLTALCNAEGDRYTATHTRLRVVSDLGPEQIAEMTAAPAVLTA